MSDCAPLRRELLEALWWQRLQDVKDLYEIVSATCNAVREQADNLAPFPAGQPELAEALWNEKMAFAEYTRVLRIFHDLTLREKLPEDPPS